MTIQEAKRELLKHARNEKVDVSRFYISKDQRVMTVAQAVKYMDWLASTGMQLPIEIVSADKDKVSNECVTLAFRQGYWK